MCTRLVRTEVAERVEDGAVIRPILVSLGGNSEVCTRLVR